MKPLQQQQHNTMIDLFAVVTPGGLLVFLERSHDFDWKALCNAMLLKASENEWSCGGNQLVHGKHSVHCLRTDEAILIVSVALRRVWHGLPFSFSSLFFALGGPSQNYSRSLG